MDGLIREYIVGGAVRDHILGIDSNDTDYLVVGLEIEELANWLASSGYQQLNSSTYLINKELKTAKAINQHGAVVDFKVAGQLTADLASRDFTINSMAISTKTGVLVDPFGGEEDLMNQELKFTQELILGELTPCYRALTPSPERLVRAARFSQQHNMCFSDEVASGFHNKFWLHELSKVNKDVLYSQCKKWIASVGSTQVLNFHNEFPGFMKALMTNLDLKFVVK